VPAESTAVANINDNAKRDEAISFLKEKPNDISYTFLAKIKLSREHKLMVAEAVTPAGTHAA